ncbi:hypothetical protein Patl1_12018 [Pistacia atlantica]|uniref:Uncharacterized protein n=1 Tax=Pistacia atlantica TaxID=434234 RepID=A0ACC1A2D4_9ROSI|nr:hypothetical protein Patl1_12018 [Pistacia atlantica]
MVFDLEKGSILCIDLAKSNSRPKCSITDDEWSGSDKKARAPSIFSRGSSDSGSSSKTWKRTRGNVAEFQPDIRMLGLCPSDYVLRTLSNVNTNDLEQTLLVLPFADALKLLPYSKDWASNPDKVILFALWNIQNFWHL